MHLSLFTNGIYPYKIGGMQKHSYYLAKYLAKMGVSMDVYIPKIQKKNKTDIFESEKIEHLNFIEVSYPNNYQFPGHYIYENFLYSQHVYREYIKRPKPDFIYIQGFSGWYLLKKLNQGKLKNPPLTGINYHGLEMFQQAPTLKVRLEHVMLSPWVKWNLRHSDFIFSLGGQLTQIQEKIAASSSKIIEIPIGITEDWLLKTPEGLGHPRKFVFIGRYERRKGIEELSNVTSSLAKETNLDFECHFIGPIPENKQIKGSTNIIYHGEIRNENKIKDILRVSDVLVCPSWSEGMPTVILEAMASGCAIIATDVGAVNQQVDSSNGVLIPAGDEDALKNAILKMIHLPEKELLKMKKGSIERIKENFLWEKVAIKTISNIKKLIS